jgi:rSAM/selenodomain-associated transferase 2
MYISIIIPVINEAERIAPLLRYLTKHGKNDVLEILVVDGGSSDRTQTIASEAGARVIDCPICSRAAQMNAGAREAKGDILYFVHADTTPPESFAADILHSIQEGYVMGCYRYRFDSPNKLLQINAFFNRFHWLWCQGGDKTFFIRRPVFEKFNGYDTFYSVMEEYDFLKRAMPVYQLDIIPKYATVSARKYEKNGWLRVQVANFTVFSLFKWGVHPDRLKRLYKKMLA